MKTKRQNHHKGWKQALSVLLVFALAAGLVLGVPALNGIAYAAPVLQDDADDAGETIPDTALRDELVKLGENCSVTVEFPKTMANVTDDDLKALQDKGVVSDLYLIAPAVLRSGYDVYDYCIDSTMPYYGLVKAYLEKTSGWDTEDPSNTAPDGYTDGPAGTEYFVFRYAPENYMLADPSEREGLAELLAELYFAPAMLPDAAETTRTALAATEAAPDSKSIGEAHTDLSAGLYMNVVHGTAETLEDWNDYVVLVKSTDSEGTAVEKVGTVAYSDTKVYTFQPQLISLPGLAGGDANGNPQMDTTQNTAWLYNMTIDAKGEAADRYADLMLEKQLDRIVDGASAVFVFRVDAYKTGEVSGTPDHTETVTLRADNLTSKVITGKIPAGSTVVITEVYSGAGYQFSNAAVTTEWNVDEGAEKNDPLPEITTEVGTDSITIYNIPAGRVYLTAPSGDENTLTDGTTETVLITNTHDDNNNGGAVVNSFMQDENGGWSWTKRTMNAQGEWVNDPAVPVTQTEEG